jgi:hypothetical protein
LKVFNNELDILEKALAGEAPNTSDLGDEDDGVSPMGNDETGEAY